MNSRTFEQLLAEAQGNQGLLLAMARENLRLHYLLDEGNYWALAGIEMTYEDCRLIIDRLSPPKRPDPLS